MFLYTSSYDQLFGHYDLYAFDSKEIDQIDQGMADKEVVNIGFFSDRDSIAWVEEKEAIKTFNNCKYVFLARLEKANASAEIEGEYFMEGEVIGTFEVYDLETMKLIDITKLSAGNSFQVRLSENHNTVEDAAFDNLIRNH